MFYICLYSHHYRDVCDVVSLLVYCPSERSFLLTKESSGEYWIPSSKAEKNCWKMTAHRINFELFGMDAGVQCQPLRIYKVWLPSHPQQCVYHAVYKVAVKADIKKRAKMKGIRNRLHWFNSVELERQRAHSSLRSPEVSIFAQLVMGEQPKDNELQEMETGMLIEICEENVIVGNDSGGGAVALASPNCALLLAANYGREDQIRLYKEFFVMVFPALYMSPFVFSQFMVELGWQRAQCPSLFRAADVAGRGGLSFVETMLWVAALEPSTPHSGIPAEIRCRYIFRYFDSNRDMQLEYVEFKELVGAARAARQLPVDALSVARDAEVCLRALGLQPNSPLPLSEFLRGVGELRLRGTSSLLRAPRSIAGYLIDLQGRDVEDAQGNSSPSTSKVGLASAPQPPGLPKLANPPPRPQSGVQKTVDFSVAAYTVRLRKRAPVEMCELANFDDDAVSPSTARLVATVGAGVPSTELLGQKSSPAEALAAVHHFASIIEKQHVRYDNDLQDPLSKSAWSWANPAEETTMGSMLLKLAEAVRPICTNEPRLLRLSSPVYAIGDLHGNLATLLALEAALWPAGPALAPARLMFLGDFVDRGPHGAELMAYLLAAKLQRPAGVLLVRGNHETRDIQKMFTFYNECVAKYGDQEGVKIWNAINMVFDALPLAAVVDDKVFCCHGGIPPPWVCPLITAIDKVPVPLPRPAEQSSIAWELLWNDPINPSKITATLQLELTANEGFAANAKRGTGHVFDQTALDRFLLANQLSHVLRAHQLHPNGFMCQLRGRLISVFSSSHYCGGSNDAGVALVEGGKLRLMRISDE
ncbi:uncharacterized protein LOC106132186 [Amyelois transitella]|uniref:uncharacterized protein LOC106132186 n=1 Tax=Amyelois transitella TaxID=680683 RepID=UPI00298F9BF0|nr:uncharacterized protein LOC106132186 [Amyelois transitella]